MHVPRVLATFRAAGINAITLATDYEAVDRKGYNTILDFLPDAEAWRILRRQSQATTRGGGLRRAPKRGHRSISILTPFVAYQTYLALECISVFALRPAPLY